MHNRNNNNYLPLIVRSKAHCFILAIYSFWCHSAINWHHTNTITFASPCPFTEYYIIGEPPKTAERASNNVTTLSPNLISSHAALWCVYVYVCMPSWLCTSVQHFLCTNVCVIFRYVSRRQPFCPEMYVRADYYGDIFFSQIVPIWTSYYTDIVCLVLGAKYKQHTTTATQWTPCCNRLAVTLQPCRPAGSIGTLCCGVLCHTYMPPDDALCTALFMYEFAGVVFRYFSPN